MTAQALPTMSAFEIRHAVGDPDRLLWDRYVRSHAHASLYHLFGWGNVIREAYGHSTHYLMDLARGRCGSEDRVTGILPVVHMKYAGFGNRLVSLPFLDGGGLLADNPDAEQRLLAAVVALGRQRGAQSIELRHERCDGEGLLAVPEPTGRGLPRIATRSHKARMLLKLPESSEMLVKSFKSKLRSQINRALKEDFTTRIGGSELLEDFYEVFAVNMRDLGSPVHSARLMQRCMIEFREQSRIAVVYRSAQPVAAALVVGLGEVLRNPWASSLRKFATLGPNMLLYLQLLQYACDHGYRVFDFGRSTPGEGTYKFKEQWGAVPAPLHWHCISLDGRPPTAERTGEVPLRMAARCWRKLPVGVTKIIGPRIRKHISL
jgi:FemAB-related protein (PEP-CTERM system-associated)